MKFGENIQLQRENHNLSQQELADILGVTRQFVSKWENDTSLPSFKNVLAIGALYDVALDELIRGDERLVEKFEDRSAGHYTPVEIILFTLIVASVVVFILRNFDAKLANWPYLVNMAFYTIQLIAFITVLIMAPWQRINELLRQKKWFFFVVLVWVLLVFTPDMVDFFRGFLDGFFGIVKQY